MIKKIELVLLLVLRDAGLDRISNGSHQVFQCRPYLPIQRLIWAHCQARTTHRRAWFKLRRWQPARQRLGRSKLAHVPPVLAPLSVSKSHQSADSVVDSCVTIGWLKARSLRNKTSAVRTEMIERSCDVFAVTETWHTAEVSMSYLHLWHPSLNWWSLADFSKICRR